MSGPSDRNQSAKDTLLPIFQQQPWHRFQPWFEKTVSIRNGRPVVSERRLKSKDSHARQPSLFIISVMIVVVTIAVIVLKNVDRMFNISFDESFIISAAVRRGRVDKIS